MVNTRQNQSSQDIDEDMPVKDSNATESSSLNNRVSDLEALCGLPEVCQR